MTLTRREILAVLGGVSTVSLSRFFAEFDWLDVGYMDADDMEVESLKTGELNRKEYVVAPSQEEGYDTVQAAHDAIEAEWGDGGGRIVLAETVAETGIEVRINNLTLEGRGSRHYPGNQQLDVSGGPGIDLPQGARYGIDIRNLAIQADSNTPYAIRVADSLVDSRIENVMIQSATDGIVFTGGSIMDNVFDVKIRNCDGWGFKVDLQSGTDYFNQNHFIRLSTDGNGSGGLLLDGVNDVDGPSEIVGNTWANLRLEQDAIPMRIATAGNFRWNQFGGYGLEAPTTGPAEFNPDHSLAYGNEWTGRITAGDLDQSTFDAGDWKTFHAPQEGTNFARYDNLTVTQDNVGDLTAYDGDNVTVGSGRGTIFDVTGTVDVLGGEIHGFLTTDVVVTWADGTEDTLPAAAHRGKDDAGNQFTATKIPPIKDVSTLEFTDGTTNNHDYGYNVLTR